jgi:hypothetical protein
MAKNFLLVNLVLVSFYGYGQGTGQKFISGWSSKLRSKDEFEK